MSNDWQTWAALLVVLVAAALLLRRAFSRKKQPGCGSGGCGPAKLRVRLVDQAARASKKE